MNVKLIFLLFLSSLSVTPQDIDFPEDNSVKTKMFDTINSFIDACNMPLFQVNAFFQAQFDAAVASLWLYTRQVFLSANTRGFALAGPRRSEFAECFASLEETIDKVIEHLTNEAMKPIFDVRQAVTQVEIHLNTQLDLVKDTIIKGTNQQCLQRTQPQLTEYALAMAYRDFNLFLQRGLQEASQRTLLDYNARFTSDLGFAVRQIIQIRAAIQAARTREAIGSFIDNVCRPFVFHRFEVLIDSANDVVQGLFKKIHDTLDEAGEKLPYDPPFFFQLQSCTH